MQCNWLSLKLANFFVYLCVCLSVCVHAWYQCNWTLIYYYLSQKQCISIYITLSHLVCEHRELHCMSQHFLISLFFLLLNF